MSERFTDPMQSTTCDARAASAWRSGCAVRLRGNAPAGLAGREGEVLGALGADPARAGRWQVRLLADPWSDPAVVEVFGDEMLALPMRRRAPLACAARRRGPRMSALPRVPAAAHRPARATLSERPPLAP